MIASVLFAAALQGAEIDIDALGWMAGCWEGEAFGGRVEECWLPAPGGRLIGMFQLIHDEGQVFSEYFQIADFGDGPAMKLKHFNPDFTSWEAEGEFTVFTLQSAGPDEAVFEGLTYARAADGGLQVDLAMRTQDGFRTESFRLRPMPR